MCGRTGTSHCRSWLVARLSFVLVRTRDFNTSLCFEKIRITKVCADCHFKVYLGNNLKALRNISNTCPNQASPLVPHTSHLSNRRCPKFPCLIKVCHNVNHLEGGPGVGTSKYPAKASLKLVTASYLPVTVVNLVDGLFILG